MNNFTRFIMSSMGGDCDELDCAGSEVIYTHMYDYGLVNINLVFVCREGGFTDIQQGHSRQDGGLNSLYRKTHPLFLLRSLYYLYMTGR